MSDDTLPPLPFAVFDEFGVPADDRVQNWAIARADAAIEPGCTCAICASAPRSSPGHWTRHQTCYSIPRGLWLGSTTRAMTR